MEGYSLTRSNPWSTDNLHAVTNVPPIASKAAKPFLKLDDLIDVTDTNVLGGNPRPDLLVHGCRLIRAFQIIRPATMATRIQITNSGLIDCILDPLQGFIEKPGICVRRDRGQNFLDVLNSLS